MKILLALSVLGALAVACNANCAALYKHRQENGENFAFENCNEAEAEARRQGVGSVFSCTEDGFYQAKQRDGSMLMCVDCFNTKLAGVDDIPIGDFSNFGGQFCKCARSKSEALPGTDTLLCADDGHHFKSLQYTNGEYSCRCSHSGDVVEHGSRELTADDESFCANLHSTGYDSVESESQESDED